MADKKTKTIRAKKVAAKKEAIEAAEEKAMTVMEVEPIETVEEKATEEKIENTNTGSTTSMNLSGTMLEEKQMLVIDYQVPNSNLKATCRYLITIRDYIADDGVTISRTTLGWSKITGSGKIHLPNGKAFLMERAPLLLFITAVENFSILKDRIIGKYDAEAEAEEEAKKTRNKYRYNWSTQPSNWDPKDKRECGTPYLQLQVQDIPAKNWQYVKYHNGQTLDTIDDIGSMDMRSFQRLFHPQEEKLRKCIKDEKVVARIMEATQWESQDQLDPKCFTAYPYIKQEKPKEVIPDDEWFD